MCGGEGVGPEQPWEGMGVGCDDWFKSNIIFIHATYQKKKKVQPSTQPERTLKITWCSTKL